MSINTPETSHPHASIRTLRFIGSKRAPCLTTDAVEIGSELPGPLNFLFQPSYWISLAAELTVINQETPETEMQEGGKRVGGCDLAACS